MNRVEVGNRLRHARESLGLSRNEVTTQVGIGTTTLQQWETGGREASLEVIEKLSKIYKTSPQHLIFGDTVTSTTPTAQPLPPTNDDEIARISIFDVEASAGHGCFTEWATPIGYEPVKKRWMQTRGLNPKNLAIIYTKGDSMTPTIPEGSRIIIDTSSDKAYDGKIYVIRIEDRLFVKRVQWLPTGGLRLISDNKFYDPMDVTKEDMQANDMQVCGQVIHACYDLPV